MTVERAAELVNIMRKLDHRGAYNLFAHFDEYFRFSVKNREMFAKMCGYILHEPLRNLNDEV